jgi:hypothetical protein
MKTPSFYTVIPAYVRYNHELTDFDKLMYGEIAALTNANNYCWATNKYFARVFNKAEKTIQRSISRLTKSQVIKSTVKSENGNERILTLIMPMDKNDPTPTDKNVHTSRARPKTRTNNTRFNNKLLPQDVKVDWFDEYLEEYEKNKGAK